MIRRLRTIRARMASDRGYAVVMTALVLIPLMGFAGFAVDVGAWYSRAASIQRAADSAALAGVVWQPDFSEAESRARSAASRNGFTHGVDGIEVIVTNDGSNQLGVEIIDTDADTFFAGLFLDNVTIGRNAVGEYAQPVPLGSPANVIGLGTESLNGEAPSNAWSAMMGHCTHAAYGDLLSITSNDDFGANNGSCGTYYSNPYHKDTGYEWFVDVPTNTATDINIFDYGTCRNADRGGVSIAQNDDYNTPIRYTFYDIDPTPLDGSFDIVLGTLTGDAVAGCGVWTTAFTTPPVAGTYMVRTEILDSDGDQTFDTLPADESGLNYFSLWADSAASATTYCLTFSDPNCPGVYANKWMPVRTDPPNSAVPAIFYLAEIEPQHQGKTLVISLWDPGEGMESMEILDPNGTAVDFTYETAYKVKGATAGLTNAAPCSLSSYCLDVTGAVWDGQLVEIRVDLSTLAWGSYPNDWFRVRYVLGGGTSADWTTWGVEVVGDPVRLLE